MKKFLLIVSLSLVLTTGLLFLAYLRVTNNLEKPERKMIPSTRIFYEDGTPLLTPRNIWINLEDVPKEFIDLLLISEDENFFKHPGIDISGLLRAAFVNLKTLSLSQGGSTITQQLARTLYLSYEKSIVRKFKEILIALWLEKALTKQEILEMYLNSVYMGNGLYGFQTAARYYFGKNLWELSVPEMAMLIATIRSPERYNPLANLELSKRKAESVLKRAFSEKRINKEEYGRYIKELSELKIKSVKFSFDEELFWRVIREAEEIGLSLGELRNGYKIYLTLDKHLQEAVDAVVKNDETLAVVAINVNTGEILAYKGIGVQYGTGWRQTGSAIKPLYYYYAILKGANPRDLLPNVPIDVRGWRPKNFDERFTGIATLRESLAYSLNIPSVFLYDYLSHSEVKAFITETLKVRARYPDDLTASLGTVETAPEELLKAYAALVNGGTVLKPYLISRIEDKNGNVVYKGIPKIESVVPAYVRTPQEASLILKGILLNVVNFGTGVRARIVGKNVLGKTGTSDLNAWFIGGDENVLIGVVKDGKKLTGGVDCAPVWKEIVLRWGKLEGKVNYKDVGDRTNRRFLVKRESLNMIDYQELVNLVRSGGVRIESMVDMFRYLPSDARVEFLSKVNSVDPFLSLEIWGGSLVGGGGE